MHLMPTKATYMSFLCFNSQNYLFTRHMVILVALVDIDILFRVYCVILYLS